MSLLDNTNEIERLLNRGFVFGSIWIMGIGSVIAVISAYQADKLLKLSGDKFYLRRKIIKCYLLGIIGILIVLAAIIFVILYRKK